MKLIHDYIAMFKAIKGEDGLPIYRSASDDFLRFMAASKIYNDERARLVHAAQKGGSRYIISYRHKSGVASYAPGESLGFLEVIASTDDRDLEQERFTPAAMMMGQHVVAYKAYRLGRAYFDINHNGQADRSIIPVESHPLRLDKGASGWRYLLYLDSVPLRLKAERGQLHGLSVAGLAFI